MTYIFRGLTEALLAKIVSHNFHYLYLALVHKFQWDANSTQLGLVKLYKYQQDTVSEEGYLPTSEQFPIKLILILFFVLKLKTEIPNTCLIQIFT